jgi:hypothetical protein
MPDPQESDVVKLYELLKSAERQQQVGLRVLKAVILDVLRSKVGGDPPSWARRSGGGESCVSTVVQELVASVKLTEEERKILDELEKEEGDRHSVSDG